MGHKRLRPVVHLSPRAAAGGRTGDFAQMGEGRPARGPARPGNRLPRLRPADVRDAHLAHQLRREGYLLRQIAPLIAQVRRAGGLPHWKLP